MWFGGLGKPAPPRTRQRESERFGSDLLTCPLGDVYDLSASGIRLRGKGRCKLAVGQCLAVTLEAPQGALTLQARVVRIQRHGLRMFDVGMQFIAITPATARALKTLAEFGFVSGRGAAPQVATAAPSADSPPQQPAVAADQAHQARLEQARAILRISADATAAEVKAAYRRLAREFHPDVHPGPGADRQFADIADAYQTLRAAMSGSTAGA